MVPTVPPEQKPNYLACALAIRRLSMHTGKCEQNAQIGAHCHPQKLQCRRWYSLRPTETSANVLAVSLIAVQYICSSCISVYCLIFHITPSPASRQLMELIELTNRRFWCPFLEQTLPTPRQCRKLYLQMIESSFEDKIMPHLDRLMTFSGKVLRIVRINSSSVIMTAFLIFLIASKIIYSLCFALMVSL